MSHRQSLATVMLALSTDKYPDDERARRALNVLTYADCDRASQFVTAFDFSLPLPVEYRRTVAEQLSAINTDAGLAGIPITLPWHWKRSIELVWQWFVILRRDRK